ncbi:putative AC transposase [Fusarium oxysporum f. sp. rapae]|uniref:Putative AC transposase n=1 Tax=Fusarium oxysporum f. sp. rapae TaxID=485398 RepID=A0A8J5NNL5_FUSOX|nr:putative AC transposase [Fusarium oxysporum f. sp. rapae]
MLPSPPPSAFSFLRPPRNLASQFELTTQSALPDHPTVADLPRAVWRNKRYVLEESLSRKGSKGRKSWIKRHGFFLVEIDTNDSPLSPYWACRLCDAKGQPEFFAAAATSSAADHLRKSHRIFEGSQAADPDLSTDESERPKRRRLQYSAVPLARVKMIRELSLGLLINTNVPFSFFSDTFFQQLAWQLDPHLADQIPWSRQSMGRLLDDTYKSKKDEIKQELSDALTKIHLGFDLWTSPNRHAVMAVTAHFLDRQGKHQSRLLALRRQLGGPSRNRDLGQRIFKRQLSRELLRRSRRRDESGGRSGQTYARYGHILNLVARAFLYGEDFESFEAESQVFDLLGRREDDLRHWRKKGPVGKLHNVIKFIRSSPQRCELFKRISRENDEAQEYLLASESTAELEVVMNNDTRWNSTYLMISRALVKQGDIRAFLVHPEVEKWLPEADMLKGDDWRLLAEIKLILEPFYLQTMRTQGWGSEGGNGRLWEVMTGMEYLLEHLEDRKLFHHAVPDEAGGQDTNSQAELARGRPDRKAPCQIVVRDNAMMDQASHQDH